MHTVTPIHSLYCQKYFNGCSLLCKYLLQVYACMGCLTFCNLYDATTPPKVEPLCVCVCLSVCLIVKTLRHSCFFNVLDVIVFVLIIVFSVFC